MSKRHAFEMSITLDEAIALLVIVEAGDVDALSKCDAQALPSPEFAHLCPISIAVQSESMPMLEYVLKLYEIFYRRVRRKDLNRQNARHQTALHWAVHLNDEAMVRLLLRLGADPNLQDKNGDNCLHYCVLSRNCLILRMLLQAGSDERALNRMGHAALHDFIYFYGGRDGSDGELDVETATCLCMLKNVPCSRGLNRLSFTGGKHAYRAMKFFLQGDDPNEICQVGYGEITPLIATMLAFDTNQAQAFQCMLLLLEHGANPETSFGGVHILELLFSKQLSYEIVLEMRRHEMFYPNFEYIITAVCSETPEHLQNLLVYGLNTNFEIDIPGGGDYTFFEFIDILLERDDENAAHLKRSKEVLMRVQRLKLEAIINPLSFTLRAKESNWLEFLQLQNQWVPSLTADSRAFLREWGRKRLLEHRNVMMVCSHNSDLYRRFTHGSFIRQRIYAFLMLTPKEFHFACFCARTL